MSGRWGLGGKQNVAAHYLPFSSAYYSCKGSKGGIKGDTLAPTTPFTVTPHDSEPYT